VNADNKLSATAQEIRFPRFEFLVLFLPVAVLVIVAGLSFAWMQTQNRFEDLIQQDSTRLHMISGFIGAEVTNSLHHLRALAGEDEVARAVEGDDSDRADLERTLAQLARRNPQYLQIRWIDRRGVERVRINRDGDSVEAAAGTKLRDRSDRYYVAEADALLADEIYLSRIDFHAKTAAPDVPPSPVVRIATPLFGEGGARRGTLMLTLALHHLFDTLGPSAARDAPVDLLLLNPQGLRLNQPSTAWDAHEADFKASHSRVWDRVQRAASGHVEGADGLWTWRKLSPLAAFSNSRPWLRATGAGTTRVIADDFSLILLAHRPLAMLMEIRRDARLLASLGILLGLAIYGFALYFYLSGHVRARRAELNATFAMARASSLSRLKELEERFRRLVEASSIGQLVVDTNGTIEIANPAAEKMLGYAPAELQGTHVERLLPSPLQAQHKHLREGFMEAPRARLMGAGRALAAVRKDGSEIPVEIGLNPYRDEGRLLVLVSIINLDRAVPGHV
jgi:PAS domain S-box-containing protein